MSAVLLPRSHIERIIGGIANARNVSTTLNLCTEHKHEGNLFGKCTYYSYSYDYIHTTIYILTYIFGACEVGSLVGIVYFLRFSDKTSVKEETLLL